MRTRTRLLLFVTVLAACHLTSPRSGLAQGPGAVFPGSAGFTFTFDEKGNSLLNGGPNPNPVVFIGGGGIQYYLPTPVIPGDVLVVSPSTDSNQYGGPAGYSDLLTFFNLNTTAGQVGVMYYQSLIDETTGPDDPADVSAFPTTTSFIVNEIGPEGNNSFVWVPDPPNAAGAVYNGVSDGVVPEPPALILQALGVVGMVAMGWRHHRTRAQPIPKDLVHRSIEIVAAADVPPCTATQR
jgi:hypothetical protein